ncbi:hypothetical protein CWI75_09415 [Kineobactrum sediminis]|uniref:Endonuclease/exonuclease/phosphatase domain-containing protein n=1 Tax=Kineobactrum sediminis TaxID=1905677 RepID=A0A2N5Y329_9GAMM|nr:ExeM/NucH family extracellular endonuclease [Kineobactrum sediminis]PLW82777.1 hypothetical protein CWI75_09415 [Kineobactrum sediminis]
MNLISLLLVPLLAILSPIAGSQQAARAACGHPATLISVIQGSGVRSPLRGQAVDTEAIVIANLQEAGQPGGFFMQEEDVDQDRDPATSEGIFVFSKSPVTVGDRVRVRGIVGEHHGLTQISKTSVVRICARGRALPSAAVITLPFDNPSELETVEGMRVASTQILTVNDVFKLGRFGEFTVGLGRRFTPTEVAAPGTAANAVNAANDLNRLVVDDGIHRQNPEPIRFPGVGLGADNPLRVGDGIGNLSGVMTYAFGSYRLIPEGTLHRHTVNARRAVPQPAAGADLRIASFNVYNYFNGDGAGGGFPTARGADTPLELERQQAKLVAALLAMDADIIGLMEIENDGFAARSAISQLTGALNSAGGPGERYDFISTDTLRIGTDAIAVGLLYRPSVVMPINPAQLLSAANSPRNNKGAALFNDRKNRPALAQSFEHGASGDRITLVINHFKSKGSSCADVGDPEDPQLQGNCNGVRTNAAIALAHWLKTHPTGIDDTDILVMGDLNAYSMEDPIRALATAGYSNLKRRGSYTYVYDGESGNLDHALASASLKAKVVNVQDWHINADEPRVLDYNTEFKTASQHKTLYAPTPYRSSDHDPVIIDLKLSVIPD